MRVVVYGDNAPGSGGWCYASALCQMGHTVVSVPCPDSTTSFRLSYLTRTYRKLFRSLPEPLRAAHAASLVKLCKQFRPDIVIVLKGLHLGPDDILKIKDSGSWVCNINHDDFFSHNRNNWSPLQRTSLPTYDYIFATRRPNVSEVSTINRNVEFFPFAYHPPIHRTLPCFNGEWSSDVVFVGTFEASRARALEHLVSRTQIVLSIHGSQWGRISPTSPLRSSVRSSGVHYDNLCQAIGSASIALGFLRKENRDEYTQRTFEIPACGGLLLAERTEEHSRLLEEGVEAEFFDIRDHDELCQKVSSLLNDPARREEIKRRGMQAIVRGKHTYVDRLHRLFQVYELFRK